MAKDKRTFKRYLKSFEFTISLGGKSYRAESLDYSLGGYRIKYKKHRQGGMDGAA
jgi:hypothetical protein